MQLITTRNKEISFVELKKAISSGNGLELIRPGDKFAIELKNGEHVNAVCGGYVNESAPASSSRTASRISGA